MEMTNVRQPPRLAFMGSDPIAIPLLDWLAEGGAECARLVGVVTGPDRPAGRGQEVRPNAVKAWAAGRPLAVMQPGRPDEAALGALAALRPDIVLVAAYGHILRDAFIALPRLGTLNLHASLLPRYRGASPVQAAVASGDAVTGMTLMRIVRELDAGPVAGEERVPIGPLDTAAEVESRLAAAAVTLLARSLPLLERGQLSFAVQDHASASFCRRLTREDGVLDFCAPARALAARINGLSPWPGVACDVAGVQVKFGLADALDGGPAGPPGSVLGADALGLLVATGLGVLRVRRLQRPGGRMLDAPEFLRGFPVAPATPLPSRPMPALVAAKPFGR
jgi:methionyl-tRNA formyltransferase